MTRPRVLVREKIADAGDQVSDLSPEGMAIQAEALSCLSGEQLLDQLIERLPEGVDADCIRDALADADLGELVSSATVPQELSDAISECGAG